MGVIFAHSFHQSNFNTLAEVIFVQNRNGYVAMRLLKEHYILFKMVFFFILKLYAFRFNYKIVHTIGNWELYFSIVLYNKCTRVTASLFNEMHADCHIRCGYYST